MAKGLTEEYLGEMQRDLLVLQDLWNKMRSAIVKAASGDMVSHEDENEFLKTKSDGTKYHRIVKTSLIDENTKIKSLDFDYDRMVEMFRSSISIAHIRNLPEPDQNKMREDWHRIGIQLDYIVGAYEFLQSGEVKIKRHSPSKSKKGKKGSKGGGGNVVMKVIKAALDIFGG